MDWGNHLEKKPIKQIEKTVNIKVKLPHVNKYSRQIAGIAAKE